MGKSTPKLHQVFWRLFNSKKSQICQFEDEYSNRCQNFSVASHTVQKSRALAGIAENGHVYQIGVTASDGAGVSGREFNRVGIKKASVFPGFCAKHDSSLFQGFEAGNGDLIKSDFLLLAYRSVCQELFKKERTAFIYSHPEFRKEASVAGALEISQAHLRGTEMALVDLKRTKAKLLSAIHRQDYSTLWGASFVMQSALPFTFSTSFAPEFAWDESLMLPSPNSEWNSIFCFAGNVKGKNALLFCGLDIVEHHAISQFFTSMSLIEPKKVGALALHLAIEYAENSFFKPSWIDVMLPPLKKELLERFADGIPGEPNSRKKAILSQVDMVKIGALDRAKVFRPD